MFLYVINISICYVYHCKKKVTEKLVKEDANSLDDLAEIF